jgi:hypothetical protein
MDLGAAGCHKSWMKQSTRIGIPLMLAALLSFSGCAGRPAANPQDAFFDRLTALCGNAFSGRLVTNEAPDAAMVGAPMVMHVSTCSAREIRIPFHIKTGADAGEAAWDRSRTWVISRTENGLRLTHDHRHKDGSPDAVTQYGGDTVASGAAGSQSFPVDAQSIASFRANKLDRSVTNVWTIALDALDQPNPLFAYELRRTSEHPRHFRVVFDLSAPVDAPPKAWE